MAASMPAMTSSKLGSSRRSGSASPAPAPSPNPGSWAPLSAASWPAPAACAPLAPGASPSGNSPRSPAWAESAPLLAEAWPCSPPSLPAALLSWPLSLAELLEELLAELLEELCEALSAELLEDELGLPLLLGGGVGGVEEGVDGVWGVVGVLALGQPESNRQAQATAARRASTGPGLLFDIICPDQFFRRYRLLALEAGTEPDVAQIAQQAQRHVVQVGVVVQPLQVLHPAARIHVEFYQ